MKATRFPALTLLALLGACGSAPVLKPAELTKFEPAACIEVRWQQDLGSAGLGVLTPAVTREAVFAASARHLSRFDRNSGKLHWRIEPGFTISGGVGAGEGLVLVGSDKGVVAAFDEADGKLRWQVKVSSEVLSAPQVSGEVVVVRSSNGRIAGLEAATGKRMWLYERSTPALIVRSHAGLTIRHGMVYAGFAGGRMAAIGLTKGVVIWEAAVSQPRGSTELERISDITSVPVVDDTRVCAVAFQGRLSCFDAIRGNPLWTRDLSSDKGLAMFGGVLYLTDSEGALYALDKDTGATLWKNEQLLRRAVSAPYPLSEHLLVGDFEGYLHLFDVRNGAIAARRDTDGSAILDAPVLLGDGALVQTSDGRLLSVVAAR